MAERQEDKLVIKGGKALNGRVKVSGAKNAVLKQMAASLILPKGTVTLHNIPELSDVASMIEIMSLLGSEIKYENKTLYINNENLSSSFVPMDLATKLRASFVCFGALTARFNEAKVAMPGGCNIGSRKLDLHIKGLKSLGAKITEDQGYICTEADKLHASKIYLDLPSNGATENIMIAACMAEGETVIENAARDPEIVDLANFLNAMGCKISGAGSSNIHIIGVKAEDLHSCEYTVLPDRIEAATYLIAAAMTGGTVTTESVVEEDIQALLSKFEDIGVSVKIFETQEKHDKHDKHHYVDIQVDASDRDLVATDLKTMWYPGFSTDIQPIFSALLTLCKGSSTVVENIYSSRFQHLEELDKMGADTVTKAEVAVVKGVESISGTKVQGSDLRATAALVCSALAAKGTSEVTGLKHLDRGYENIEEKLTSLGADIKRSSKHNFDFADFVKQYA